MILRYATNLKLAKELYNASKPKLQGDQGMVDTFTNTFGLPASTVKLAGGVEATAAALFAASFLNKNISRLGSLATISVLSVAAYKVDSTMTAYFSLEIVFIERWPTSFFT